MNFDDVGNNDDDLLDDNNDGDEQSYDIDFHQQEWLGQEVESSDDEEVLLDATEPRHEDAKTDTPFPLPPPPPIQQPATTPLVPRHHHHHRPPPPLSLPLWTKTQKQDLEATLEHLVIAGNHARHVAWRRREWRQRIQRAKAKSLIGAQQQQQQQRLNYQRTAARTTTTTTKRNNSINIKNRETHVAMAEYHGIPTISERLLHAEDVRLYGVPGSGSNEPQGFYPDSPWPRPIRMDHQQALAPHLWLPKLHQRIQQRDLTCMDNEWDVELGDGLRPIEFLKSKLSQRPALQQQQQQQQQSEYIPKVLLPRGRLFAVKEEVPNVSNQPGSNNCTVLATDVPRAFLLRCWERAVHAASCTMACPVSTTTTPSNIPPLALNNNNKSNDPNQQHQQPTPTNADTASITSFSSFAAAVKFGRLQLKMPPSNTTSNTSTTAPPYTCPSCQLNCDSAEQLDLHLFGTDTHGGGCIWQLIHQKQHDLIQNVLEQHITIQATTLLRLLFSLAEQDIQRKWLHRHNNNITIANAQTTAEAQAAAAAQCQSRTWQTVLDLLQTALHQSQESLPSPDFYFPTAADVLFATTTTSTNQNSANQNTANQNSANQNTVAAEATTTTTTTEPAAAAAPTVAATTRIAQMPLPPSLLETLQTETDQLPLLLNQELLTIVSERLVDRYADVPK